MNLIPNYLAVEKTKFLQLMEIFTAEQIKKYGGLAEEYRELLGHIREHLLRGGKWHRPTLAMLSYQLFGGSESQPVRQAVLVTEIMHRFLLVHDDIIDQDLVRHGGPTIEKIYRDHFNQSFAGKTDVIYSKGNAIVAGDVINALGYELILESDIDEVRKMALLRGVNRMIIETGAGWQLQNEQNYQNIDQVTYDDFFRGMQLVSCQYSIVWPLRIGQILAGKLDEAAWDQNLEVYGWNCGAAFQIIDDIIGMFGDEKTTGKPAGHDYREGKKTHLVLKAYERANKTDRKFLYDSLGTNLSTEELRAVRKIMTDTGAVQFSQDLARNHVLKALEGLEKVKSKSVKAKQLLADFASFLVTRTY